MRGHLNGETGGCCLGALAFVLLLMVKLPLFSVSPLAAVLIPDFTFTYPVVWWTVRAPQMAWQPAPSIPLASQPSSWRHSVSCPSIPGCCPPISFSSVCLVFSLLALCPAQYLCSSLILPSSPNQANPSPHSPPIPIVIFPFCPPILECPSAPIAIPLPFLPHVPSFFLTSTSANSQGDLHSKQFTFLFY